MEVTNEMETKDCNTKSKAVDLIEDKQKQLSDKDDYSMVKNNDVQKKGNDKCSPGEFKIKKLWD